MSESKSQQERELEKAGLAALIRGLYTIFKSVRLYPRQHPSNMASAQGFLKLLTEHFKIKTHFTLTHSDGLFNIDDYFFVEESLVMLDFLSSFEKLKINQVRLIKDLTEDEILEFMAGLAPSTSPEAPKSTPHIRVIVADTDDSSAVHAKNADRGNAQARIVIGEAYEGARQWQERLEKILTKIFEEQSFSVIDMSDDLEILIDHIQRHPSSYAMLFISPPPGPLLLRHSFQTMVLSIAIGLQLGLAASVIKILAIAAMVHDIGRQLLPNELATGYELAPTDVDFIHLHAVDGASFLAGVAGLPMIAVCAALEHHIGYDDQGYPDIMKKEKPHLFSQIIGLADHVSWRTVSERYYHKPKAMHRFIGSVLHRSGTQFNPLLVKLLLPFFGLYPPGTHVALSSGEDAIVLEPNPRSLSRPTVVDKTGALSSLTEQSSDLSQSFSRSIVKTKGAVEDITNLFLLVIDNKLKPASPS